MDLANDPAVNQKALASTGALLRADPIGTAPRLIAAATHPDAVASATTIAALPDPAGWVTTMTELERRAVLSVLAVQPKLFPVNRLLLVATANVLQAEVIDQLAARGEADGGLTIRPGWRFDRAFADHPEALIDWIRRGAALPACSASDGYESGPSSPGAHPPPAAQPRLHCRHPRDDRRADLPDRLLANCDNFVLNSPKLTAEIIEALTRYPSEVHDGVRAALLTYGTPFGTSRTPGAPAQQNVDNRNRAQMLSHDVCLPEPVRQLYQELQAALQRQIESDLEAELPLLPAPQKIDEGQVGRRCISARRTLGDRLPMALVPDWSGALRWRDAIQDPPLTQLRLPRVLPGAAFWIFAAKATKSARTDGSANNVAIATARAAFVGRLPCDGGTRQQQLST